MRWPKMFLLVFLVRLPAVVICLTFLLGGRGQQRATRPQMIDLRSDTVTRPSQEMREAMAAAEVGDDVYGEDPTVNALEHRVAALLNKERALFVPTGTMANLCAVMSWCALRGSEVILGDRSHMYLYEQGGAAQVAGVSPRAVPTQENGQLCLADIELAVRADNLHFPVTALLALENTHNHCGGVVLPCAYLEEVGRLTRARGIPLHVDGARLWHAAQSLKEPVASLAQAADSLSVCLSKGLGAPVGSLLVGPEAFIAGARRARKVLGGGMRQAGVLAAAGLVALDDFEAGLLAADHAMARELAEYIAALPGFLVRAETVQTNIVLVRLDEAACGPNLDPGAVCLMLRERGVLASPQVGLRALRLVTHRDVQPHMIEAVKRAFLAVSSAVSAPSRVVYTELLPSPDAASNYAGAGDKSNTDTDTDADTIATSLDDGRFVRCDISAMSVSPQGFCVILRAGERYLALPVTPFDPMEDGLDRVRAQTSEALTLLQLMQGIDDQSHLPRDALRLLAGEVATLTEVVVESVGRRLFKAVLRGPPASAAAAETSSTVVEALCDSAFQVVGLAIRYKAAIKVAMELLQEEGTSLSQREVEESFPNRVAFKASGDGEAGGGVGVGEDARMRLEKEHRKLLLERQPPPPDVD